MNKKKILKYGVVICVLVIMVLITCFCQFYNGKNINIYVKIETNSMVDQSFDVYYTTEATKEFTEDLKVSTNIIANDEELYIITLPNNVTSVRMDTGTGFEQVRFRDLTFAYGRRAFKVTDEQLSSNNVHDIKSAEFTEGDATITITGEDPYLIWNLEDWGIQSQVKAHMAKWNTIIKIIINIIILLLLICYLKKFDFYVEFPVEIYHSKRLILQLSKNDFKTKYAGSYFGIIWAFVQPIVTVVLYWFVFEKGLRAGNMVSVPFVLWLIAGLVPWFFFSEVVPGGTNALIEYQYLVKKVVFQIDILPLVKVFSALYVHCFFVVFMLILYSCYGYFPTLYTLQVIYYSFCTMMLALGIVYATSAIVGFFKDLTQIINIALQVGIWLTPIMWNFESIGLPGWLKLIFEANPLFYIVQGYRDALINHVWFFERPLMTIYFWIVTVFVLGAGTAIFKKLKIHFADVL